MKRAFVSFCVVVSFEILFIAGCKRSPAPPPAPKAEPLAQIYPTKVRVVVDTSASMRGYFSKSTEMKDTLAAIAAALERLRTQHKEVQAVQYTLLGDEGTLEDTKYTTDGFITAMLNDGLMKHRDSLLQNAFAHILETTGSSDVSLLVTDSIVSYSDADVRKNPGVNRENVAGLGSEVKTVFSHAASNEGALLLAGTSDFTGTYFDYQNQQHRCAPCRRPFYIWLIGPPAQIQSVDALLAAERVHFEHEIAFDPERLTPDAVVLERLRHTGVFFRSRHIGSKGELDERNVVEVKSFPQGKPIEFAVALDLSHLPASMQAPDYLWSHLHVTDSAHAAAVTQVASRSEVELQKGNDAADLMPGYTHVLFLTLGPGANAGEKVEISLDSELPDWYLKWSNLDDRQPATATNPTTFGLRYLVEGVAGAYAGRGPVLKTSVVVRR
jgi:hypothetical protein